LDLAIRNDASLGLPDITCNFSCVAVDQMITDHRKTHHPALRQAAWIGTGDKAPLRGCTVSDISDEGAKLHLENTGDLPDVFSLLLSGPDGIYRQCRAIGRAPDQVDVRFEKTATTLVQQDQQPRPVTL
jgi:hypothetical protein